MFDAEYLGAWLFAFAFTQIVEIPIYLWALSRAHGGASRARDAIVAFAASAITHPVVWFVFPRLFSPRAYVPMLTCAEAFAVLVEAAWLRAFGVRRALAGSLVANGASLGLGMLSRAMFGMP